MRRQVTDRTNSYDQLSREVSVNKVHLRDGEKLISKLEMHESQKTTAENFLEKIMQYGQSSMVMRVSIMIQ